MNLEKLHIFNGNASLICQRSAIARIDQGIAALAINSTRPASGNDEGFGSNKIKLSCQNIKCCDPFKFSIFNKNRRDKIFPIKIDLLFHCLFIERVQQIMSCLVGDVASAIATLSTERPLRNRSIRVAVEQCTIFIKPGDHLFGFAA